MRSRPATISGQRDARGVRGGRGAERVRHVVAAGQRQPDPRLLAADRERERGDEGARPRCGPRSPRARTSAFASMPKRRMRAPRGAIVCQSSANGSSALMTAVPSAARRREHLALGAGDAGEVAEALEVLVAGVRDQRDRGLRERGERGDLARVVGAHLDHGMAVRRLEAQQRQRHADVVVEVAARRERRARAGEDRGEQFLGGRLAVAAADAEHERAALSRARRRRAR